MTALAVLAFAGSASAATINFETTPLGTYGPAALVIGDVSFTFEDGTGTFQVSGPPNDPPRTGGCCALLSFFTNPGPGAFRATFGVARSFVSIGVGDFSPSDDDLPFFAAYDAANNLLDIDSAIIPESGPGVTLSVSSGAANIAYVRFWETGSFAGAIYWDNLTFDDQVAVPEPASMLLLGAGLMGARFARRRRSA